MLVAAIAQPSSGSPQTKAHVLAADVNMRTGCGSLE